MTNNLAWLGAGDFAVFDYGLPVDQHQVEPFGILMRFLKRGFLFDARGIEHHQISPEAFAHQAAIAKPKRARGQRRHFADGVLEREHAALAHKLRQRARIGCIGAGMGNAYAELANAAIAGESRVGVAHDAVDVDFTHGVINHLRAALGLHVQNGFDLVAQALLAAFENVDLADALAVERMIELTRSHHGPGIIFVAFLRDHVFHLFGDPGVGGGIFNALADFFLAVGKSPTRYGHAQMRAGSVVGILIDDDIHALAAVFLHQRERLIARAPEMFVVDFEMGKLDAHAGFAADAHRLIDSFDHVRAFVPHVAGVDAAVFRGSLGERYDFLGVGVGAGNINQAGGKSYRAGLHIFLDKLLHADNFIGGRQAIGRAHDRVAHGVVADERSQVQSQLDVFQAGEFRAEIGERTAAISGDDGGDAIGDEVIAAGNFLDHVLHMRVDV